MRIVIVIILSLVSVIVESQCYIPHRGKIMQIYMEDTVTIEFCADGIDIVSNLNKIKINGTPLVKGQYMTAIATDTVDFESIKDQWYMLTNETHNAFNIYQTNGFHYENDTLVAEFEGLIDVRGQFRVAGPTGVANREYEYRLIRERNGVEEVFWWFQVSSSGQVVLRTIAGFINVISGDRLWGEIRTLSATGEIHFYGGTVRVMRID